MTSEKTASTFVSAVARNQKLTQRHNTHKSERVTDPKSLREHSWGNLNLGVSGTSAVT